MHLTFVYARYRIIERVNVKDFHPFLYSIELTTFLHTPFKWFCPKVKEPRLGTFCLAIHFEKENKKETCSRLSY